MDQEKLDKQEKQDKQEKAQYKQQDKGMRIQLNQADIPPRTIKSRPYRGVDYLLSTRR